MKALPRSCVVILLFAACQTGMGSSSAELPVFGRSFGGPVPTEIAEAITVVEHTVDKTKLSIVATQPLGPIDERSTLQLTFDAIKLGELVGGPGVPAIETAEAQLRTRLQSLVNGLGVLVQSSQSLQEAVAQARLENALPEAKLAVLQSKLQLADAQWNVLVTAARDCLIDEALAEGFDVARNDDGDYVDEATAKFMRERGAALLPSGAMIDADVFAGIVQRQVDRLQTANRKAAAAASAPSGAEITVRAYLNQRSDTESSKALRVHVDNYDDLDRGTDIAKPAIGGFTEADIAELRRRFQLTKELARSVEALRKNPARLWQQLRTDLDTLGTQLAAMAGEEFDVLLIELAEVVKNDPTLRNRVQQVVDLRARAERVVAAVRSLRAAVQGEAPDVVALLQDLDSTLQTAWTELGGALETLRSLAELSSGAEITTFVNTLQGEALTRAKAAFARLATATVAGLSQATSIRVVVETIARLRPLLTLGRRVGEVDVPADDPVIGHGIEAAPPATIYLHATPAKVGDRIVVLVELTGPDGDQDRVREHRQSFQVVRRGTRDSLDSHLLFVDRLHDSGTSDQFVAAPSVSWTLHYRKLTSAEDAANADCWAGFWNTIDPGIGLNVAALSFEDGDVEAGLGVHLTFFNDILQVGYGRNLSVSDNQDYFFVGVSLIESLGALGLKDR